MNKRSKIISMILAGIMILTLLLSCANDSGDILSDDKNGNANDSGVDNTGNNQSEAENKQEAKLPPPELPEIDLQGADFVIMSSEAWGLPLWEQRDIYAAEETGDTVNDAVYKRNSIIDERYNCTIVEQKVKLEDITSKIKRFVSAGDSSLDAATIRLKQFSELVPTNNLVEFKRLTYIDTSKQWWDQNSVNDLSIAGKIFGVASDMTLMDKQSTCALAYGKKMQVDFAIENLYQLVDEGKWTLDKLLELAKLVSVDVDGNGIMDDKDAYGLLYGRDSMTSFLSGSGEFVGGKDANDLPILTLNTPKALEVLDKLYDILYDERYCFHVMKFFDAQGTNYTDGMSVMFQDNRALFMWVRMADIESLRSMSTDFGILPIPKYDEKQEKYIQTVNPWVGVVTSVPQSAASFENSSVILEAMAYESKYILQPAYYDVMLNTKIARDEESSKMLDIIFANRRYDIGDVFDFGGLGNDVIFMTMTFDRNIVSTYEKKEAKALLAIEKLIENIQALD